MNSADLSEIKMAVIYIMHLHFLNLKHRVFPHQIKKNIFKHFDCCAFISDTICAE